MNRDGRYFRFEAVLEAPMWLLIAVVLLVTVAVIASAVAL